MELKDKVIKALKTCRVKSGSRILVGFSGGPDSTTLLYVLKNCIKDYNLNIYAAYLDHGLRKKVEIEKEIKLVQDIASHLRIELFIGRIPAGELTGIAIKETRSIEEVARTKRYQFFEAVSIKVKADYIAVGHVTDDHMETLVMRFFQGGGVAGLAGIPICNNNIIRPLFYCTKEDVLTYLKHNDLRFVIDSSNLSKAFLRNKIRLNLIPVIRNIFPGYMKGLMRLSGIFHLLNGYIDEQIKKTCNWEKVSMGYRINMEKYLAVHGILRLFSLYTILNKLYNEKNLEKKVRIPYRFLSLVLDKKNIISKKVIIRGYGIVLLRQGKYLFCKPDIVYSQKKGYLICGKNGKVIKIQAMGCTIGIYNGKKEGKRKNTRVFLSENCIYYPLVLRSRRPGDKIEIENGKKSLKKLFNEWKVPEKKRWAIPILADRKRILGIVGKEFGYKNRWAPVVFTYQPEELNMVTVEIGREY